MSPVACGDGVNSNVMSRAKVAVLLLRCQNWVAELSRKVTVPVTRQEPLP